ncbi:MAG TPA: FtsH protease activity modulator HflK [Candidatus Omnitrophota bacterium]|nr:FtsH protease activity modulator HflK [Candidatus Omnitrophota bacterium]
MNAEYSSPDEQILYWINNFIRKPGTVSMLAVLIIVLWLVGGFFIVKPGEQGIIRQFGKKIRVASAGLNWRMPWPVDKVDIVNVEQVRRIEVGFGMQGRENSEYSRRRGGRSDAMMLTGDENMVEAQIIVQYKVSDPTKYLFRLYDPDGTLFTATEVALRSAVGRATIDDALTVGRQKIQEETREFLQRLMDAYESGLVITEVRLQVVDPPDQVKDAFHEVVRAREDRERLINEAKGYQEDLIPRARGEAQKMLRGAEAFKEERVLKAQGDAARFTALLAEYQKAKEVTWNRLQIETLERIYPAANKVVVDPQAGANVLPLLPLQNTSFLDSLQGSSDPAGLSRKKEVMS